MILLEKSDFEKKAISSRMMTSHQICSSEIVANFENLENQEFCYSKFPKWVSLESFNSSCIWDIYISKLGMPLLKTLLIFWGW